MKTFHATLLSLTLLVAFPASALAQEGTVEEGKVKKASHTEHETTANATVSSLKSLHEITASNITKTAEMLDEELYAFRPTEDVRTVGQMLAHVANAQYMFCSAASGKDSPNTENLEETATAKADVVAALNDAFAYCAGIYDGMSDAKGAEMKSLFGRQMTASGILAFNSAHNYEHYGNLVTYMRINGIVPPSSM